MLSDRCLPVCLSVTLVYCGQRVGWIKMKLGLEVGLGPGHIVLDENSAPPQKGGTAPCPILADVLWPNGFMDQDATWYWGRLRPRPHSVAWGPSSSPLKRGTAAPNFWPMSVVVKWLDGHIVLDGDRPTPKGAQPQFSADVCCCQAAGWINVPLGTEADLCPCHVVLDGAQLLPPGKGARQPPSFQPMSVVAKQSPISATAEHFL